MHNLCFSSRLSSQYKKSLGEVNETFSFYVSMLEERKAEIARELEQAYSNKQVALTVYSQKAQETVDKIFQVGVVKVISAGVDHLVTHQVTDFVERLMKHASNGEVLMFKKPLDARLHQLIASNPELNLATVAELEFISNFQAIQVCPPRPLARPLFHPFIILKVVLLQVGVKNQFGYVKSKPESGNKGGPGQQPPICRPGGPQQTLQQQPIGSPLPFSHQQPDPQQQHGHNLQGPNPMMLQGLLADPHHHQQQRQPLYGNQQMERSRFSGSSAGNMNPAFPSNCQLSSLLSTSSIADLANSTGINNTYEKWSSGADSLFGGLHGPPSQHDAHGFKERMGMRQPPSSNDSMMELTTKLLSQTAINSPPMPPSTPQMQNNPNSSSHSALYPPKSQIKRQKMIYHCKFGEFGILEGQFTEPSGVAVNAQNDIIVADTNNHRIQIFDKEGRFKFQFGEVSPDFL